MRRILKLQQVSAYLYEPKDKTDASLLATLAGPKKRFRESQLELLVSATDAMNIDIEIYGLSEA